MSDLSPKKHLHVLAIQCETQHISKDNKLSRLWSSIILSNSSMKFLSIRYKYRLQPFLCMRACLSQPLSLFLQFVNTRNVEDSFRITKQLKPSNKQRQRKRQRKRDVVVDPYQQRIFQKISLINVQHFFANKTFISLGAKNNRSSKHWALFVTDSTSFLIDDTERCSYVEPK